MNRILRNAKKNESRLKKLENIYASVRRQLDFLSETGKISEYYEAKTILNQGREEGVQEGAFAKAIQVYFNMLERGYPPAEAQAVSGLTDEEIEKAVRENESI